MDSQTSPSAVPGDVSAQKLLRTGVFEQLFAGVSYWSFAVTLLLLCVTYDQVRYQWNKYGIVGPAFKLPFMGPFLESINPKFEEYAAKWASGPLSCVSVFHKFVVIASTRDLARKVLNSPTYVKPCVVDIAKKILRPTNWVFLDGKAHVNYRRGLNALFTRKALSEYLPGQEDMHKRYFKRWIEISKATPGIAFMPEFREINCAVSCRTFVGDYTTDEKVKKISDDYYKITAALDLVNFPIIIPYTRTWYGKKCADMVLDEFSQCAEKSKENMAAGGTPHCLLDHWVKAMYEYRDYQERLDRGEALAPGEKAPVATPMFTNYEIAQTLFTFLFASQDASSSATTWLFQLLADRPEVLNRVREEALRVREGDPYKPINVDMLDKMVYTRAVVKETLRYRPPVTMVPYEVKKDFPVVDNYVVPKGSMIVPTLYPALHDPEVYVNPETFNPDRWLEGGEAEAAVKNWLVFGTGPHYCLGQTYAIYNFMSMISLASLMMDWEHHVTPKSEEIKVFATIFPMDDCLLTFKGRLPILD
ncbi:cytochrome P450 sterol C-22 desaturase [Kalaharituber pfeilii]|nr:cytochrome P450 sterol C-22 desaturase [Kalaharituber pfeilii]